MHATCLTELVARSTALEPLGADPCSVHLMKISRRLRRPARRDRLPVSVQLCIDLIAAARSNSTRTRPRSYAATRTRPRSSKA